MSFVKICGITNEKDAFTCIDAGADALGFVFYEKSPRYIAPKEARKIIEKLPPFISKVGLFVNENASSINAKAKIAKISLAQLHFNATKELQNSINLPCLSVKRVKSQDDLIHFDTSYTLIDAFVEEYGGMGKRIELSWLHNIDCSKLILAGGLHVKMLQEVKKYGFYGYDVSSSVEKSKGIKDKQKVMDFIQEAKK